MERWSQRLLVSEQRSRRSREQVLHLRANCEAEEQTRVALLERFFALEHEASCAERELRAAKAMVEKSRESRKAITEEIERLERELQEEAGKMVLEEREERQGLRAEEAEIIAEYGRLKGRLVLERDRCLVARALVEEMLGEEVKKKKQQKKQKEEEEEGKKQQKKEEDESGGKKKVMLVKKKESIDGDGRSESPVSISLIEEVLPSVDSEAEPVLMIDETTDDSATAGVKWRKKSV